MPTPVASVVIANYDYVIYLRDAIDSALSQTYSAIEVIVVDDGSSDTSRDVIASYGTKIGPLLKGNGGQASAVNAGFERSRGEYLVFLDADDILLPRMVERAMDAFRMQPDAVKVQFRLVVINANEEPTGVFLPSAHRKLLTGDIRQYVLRFPDDVPYPPMSGHVFRRSELRRILPIPEETYRRLGADVYLNESATSLRPYRRVGPGWWMLSRAWKEWPC